MFRSAETHLTVFLVAVECDEVTYVPSFFTSNVLLTRMGFFFDSNGSKVIGWICFAPNCAISIASEYETS